MTVTIEVEFSRGGESIRIEVVLVRKLRGDALTSAISDAVDVHPACSGWSKWKRIK